MNETQSAVGDAVRAFAQEKLRPRSSEFEAAKGYPASLFEELAGLGLMGVIAPEAFGGAALDYVSYAQGLIELAAGDGALSTILICFCLSLVQRTKRILAPNLGKIIGNHRPITETY